MTSSSSPETLWLAPDEMAARAGRVPSLDGFRAISITIVLLSHFVDFRLFPGGLGVLVFFVISGFLITRLLFTEWKSTGTLSLRRFYARRFMRLYPVIVVYTVVIVATRWWAGDPIDAVQPLSALLYFANYLYSYIYLHETFDGMMPFDIFWSLSVEEHFYFLFPPIVLALRASRSGLARLLVLVCGACLALRVAVALARPDLLGTFVFYYQTEFRLDSLAVGVLVAVLCESASGRAALLRLTHPAVFAGAITVILAGLVIRDPFFRDTIRYTLFNGAVAAVIVAVLFSGRYRHLAWLLNTRAAIWVGRLSYSIYVWHLTVPLVMQRYDAVSKPMLVGIEFAGTFLIAAVSYYCVEQPFVGLRHRLRPKGRRQDGVPEHPRAVDTSPR